MKLKTFDLKGEKVGFCNLTCDKSNSFMIVAIFNSNQVGYCSFSIEGKICKLSRIAVTDEKFLDKGVGSIMFQAMEQFAVERGVSEISALFIPRGYENAWEITSKFYQKHNMKTFDYDFDYFDRQEISKVPTQHLDCQLPLVVSDEAYNLVSDYNYNENDMFSSNRDSNPNPLKIEL